MSDAPAAPAAPAPTDAGTPSPADLAAQLAAQGTEGGPGITPPGAPAPTPTPPPAPAAPEGIAEPDWSNPDAVKAWAAKMQKTNADLRRENGDARMNTKAQAAADERERILKLLNPQTETAPTIEAVQAAQHAAAFEAATARAAWALKVDPGKAELLEFKLSRNAEAKALDPTAPDFQTKLTAIVQAEIARDSSLGQAAPAPVASTENLGGADGAGTVTLDAFKAMNMAERGALYNTDQALYRKLADQLA